MANKPNNPALWSRAKSLAKQKFDVYPSAYANGWAAKWYKGKGGSWRKAEYGMEVNDSMAQGGEKMPPEIARARFAAAGNLDQMDNYGYAYGGYTPQMMYGGKGYMQQGGQQDEVMQIIQMFAQMSQMDPAQIMQQLQQMPPEEQQQAIQQMAETLQQGGGQQPDMMQAAMMYGGYTTGMFAEGGEPNGGMALGQMSAVSDKMNKLRQFVSPDQNLDPWIASKLAVMDDSAAAISDYMMYNPEAQGGEEEMMEEQMPEMGRGGYTVTRSNDRKGKTHKVTGPDGKTVKYFGDSNLGQHPGNPKRKAAFYARHKKNLDGNPYFRAFARATWEDGGQLDYAQFGMQKNDTYNPYLAKQAQSDQYTNIMNQYQGNSQKNRSNMYSGLEGSLQQMAMDKYAKEMMRTFQNQRSLQQMNSSAPKYSMDTATGKISIKEPDFKTDNYAQGGYVNNMYYAQGGMEIPRQEDFPDYNTFSQAMQEWQATGEYQNFMNPPAMMADSLPIAQPMMGVPPVQNVVASQAALNPYEGVSVYDFLSAQNKAPDYASRKVLASQLGIKNYTGRADQNKQIIDMIKQNPGVLQSYAPSAGSKSSPKTTTVIDKQGNPVQVPAPTPEVKKALDTIASIAKNLPDSTKGNTVNSDNNTSEDGASLTDWLKIIGIVLGSGAVIGGTTAAATYGTVDLIDMIKENKFKLPATSQSKLIESLEVLRKNALESGTEKVKQTVESYNSAKESVGRLRGRLAQNISNKTNAALAAIEGEDDVVKALSEAEAERKALRSFNGQKAAAIRWGKPVPTAPKFPSLGGAPAAAKEGNAFMNALREAQLAARETPWINTTMKFMKRMPKFQEGGEPDSLGENIWEWLDPTGTSSWDDVRRSWNDTSIDKPWYQTPLEIAGAIPVFGKLGKVGKAVKLGVDAASTIGKGAKEVKAASTASKVWKGTKKGVGTTLDWVGGSAPQRFIDQSINPLTRGMGALTQRGLANFPKLSYVARGIQPFQQGQRFWKGVGDVTGQGLGTMNVPAPELQELRLITPDGKIINTNTGDPKVLELMNKGMIDTAAANYNNTAGGWNLKPGAKYKGGGSTFSGNAWYRDGGTNNAGFRALPDYVQNQILSNMAYGGIQLDPAKKGTFKAQATRMGMGVQQAASSILNAPEGKYSPAMRKKANFAKNFAKQEGGQILDVTPEELEMLRQQGYQFEIM
jgi:hypothetical protein